VRARIAASIVLAVALAVGTAGCGFITPQTTQKHYDASDGVSGNVGDINVRNALIISGTGNVGNLVTTIVNNGSRAARVEVQRSSGGSAKNEFVIIPAGTTKKIGEKGGSLVILKGMDSRPGSLYPLYFQYGSHTGLRLLVPVLNGQLPEYSHLLPVEVIPVPKPRPTPLPGETATPTPTATPVAG
jgi:hypothetical protein